MQQWPLTRLVDATIHDWDMFIRPGELAGVLERHGLKIGETAGLGPRASLATVFASFVAARRGRITHAEFSRRLDVGRIASTAVSYMGFATKAGPYPRDGAVSAAAAVRTSRADDCRLASARSKGPAQCNPN